MFLLFTLLLSPLFLLTTDQKTEDQKTKINRQLRARTAICWTEFLDFFAI